MRAVFKYNFILTYGWFLEYNLPVISTTCVIRFSALMHTQFKVFLEINWNWIILQDST